ncbi:actin cytoskeleton-regulatory complex protein PAN1-like [Pollicipes pollicipes]|uniref:actin cytoskeleton-regulatory complex protein PAN1-like n=1 Tax=Pollicipes pollicipes TaxID=41117 RepID=UPI0018852C7D|nr:actin cytoskeleton-regulatory complex protein PAN1-like [Pollicipes pollicipes]
MVAETLLSSVQFAGLKSRFNSMSTGYFNYPPGSGPAARPAGGGAPLGGLPEPYPVSPLELPTSLQCDMFNQRKQREFIPDNKKDESYWDRRRRNNEAAKRSREKRRLTDMVLESRVFELTKENYLMRAQLSAIRDKFGIVGENLINHEQVLAQLPAMDQILNFTKRHKPMAGAHMLPLAAGGVTFPVSAAPPPPPPPPPPPAGAAPAYRQTSPPPPPPPAGLLFRQQSLREVRMSEEEEARDYSRPRSAEPQRAPPPPLHPLAAVNLSKPAARPAASPEASALPLKLRHKTLMCERETAAANLLVLNQLKEEPQDSPGSDASSGDERDSGLSDRSASSDGADEPSRKRPRSGCRRLAAPVRPHPRRRLRLRPRRPGQRTDPQRAGAAGEGGSVAEVSAEPPGDQPAAR